jgi:ASC-1-like (ASCH) protein
MIYTATLYERPFLNLTSGKKFKELRVDKPKYGQVKPGDIILFSNVESDKDFRMAEVLVKGVFRYASLEDVVQEHDPRKILPSAETASDLEQALLRYYSLDVIKQFGILIWDITLVAVHLHPIKKLG